MFLLAALFILAVVPLLEAASKNPPKTPPGPENCVADSGCPKGMGPPKCCAPPKCEFLDALQKARAMRDIFQERFASSGGSQESSTEDELAPLLPEGQDDLAPLEPVEEMGQEEYEKFMEETSDAMNWARDNFPKCPKRKRYRDPPIFSVHESDGCLLKTRTGTGQFSELSLDEVKQGSKSCSELIDAKYAAAVERQTTCGMEVVDKTSYRERALSRGNELEAEYQSLLGALQQYWSRCSIKPGSKLAREVAARGINELKFNPPAPPKKKGPSKKSGKRGR
jgi:hypothetical protein